MEKLLTFEYEKSSPGVLEKSSPGVLHIHLNPEGAQEMIEIFQRLLRSGLNEHDHLMTPSWGGTELTEDKQDDATTLVNQVNVFLWRE